MCDLRHMLKISQSKNASGRNFFLDTGEDYYVILDSGKIITRPACTHLWIVAAPRGRYGMDEIQKELAGKKVLIVDDDEEFTEMLREQIASIGMNVVGTARNCAEAVKLSEQTAPALIIMDIRFDGKKDDGDGEPDGIETARIINEREPRPILVLSGYSDGKLIRRAKAAGVNTYLVKPVPLPALLPSIVLTMERFRELMIIKSELYEIRENLANRKVIEQAKGILMEKKEMSEKAAYTYLRTLSQKENKPMVDIARMIVAMRELL